MSLSTKHPFGLDGTSHSTPSQPSLSIPKRKGLFKSRFSTINSTNPSSLPQNDQSNPMTPPTKNSSSPPISFSQPNLRYGQTLDTPLSSPRNTSFSPDASGVTQRRVSPNILAFRDNLSSSNKSGTDDAQWSSAIGHNASTATGRVIEKLQSDADRLRRDLKAEQMHREELQKRNDALQTSVESLQAENAVLSQAKETDNAILRRRDRKIEDFKAQVDAERGKRQAAENSLREKANHFDTIIAASKEEVSQAGEKAEFAENSTKILRESYQNLQALTTHDVKLLKSNRESDSRLIQQYIKVRDEQAEQIENLEALNRQLTESFEILKQSTAAEITDMERDFMQAKEALVMEKKRIDKEVGEVLEDAKWYTNLAKRIS